MRRAAEAVRGQADRVRALKAAAAASNSSGAADADDPHRSRGSPANRDPAVLEAVAELGRLKARLAEVEAMRAAFFGGGSGEEDEENEEEEGASAAAPAAAAAGVGGELMRELLQLAEEAEIVSGAA